MSGFQKISGLVLWAGLSLMAQAPMPAGNVELGQIQRVYVLPMTNSFDHYLVNRLRSVSTIRIVTDPMKADAYFTDRLGVSFEDKLKEFDEKSAEMAAAKVAPELATDEQLKKEADNAFRLAPKMVSSIGRGKGTIFLVERSSRNVVWSIYEKPKDTLPKTLDKTAEKVAEEFKKELVGRK